MSITYINEKSRLERVKIEALFYSFSSLFNVWLTRRLMEPHVCVCIHAVPTLHTMQSLENALHAHERMS